MQATVTTTALKTEVSTDLKAAHDYIYAIDFSMIVNKLVKRHKWLRLEALEACQQYRNFLFLAKKYNAVKGLVPSKAIDEFWHHHILDTMRYHEDMHAIFGCYKHHLPSYDADENPEQMHQGYERTQALYLKEFGEPLTTTHYFLRPLLRLLSV